MEVHECPKAILCGYCPFSYDFESVIKHLFQHNTSELECAELNGQEALISKIVNIVPQHRQY